MTTRLRRAGAALAAASALALSVTACGGEDAPATAVAPAAAAPAATSTPTATLSPVAAAVAQGAPTVGLDDCQDKAPVTPETTSVFGEAKVRNAYCTAVAFTLDTSYVPSLTHYTAGASHQPSEFDFVTEHMTTAGGQAWSKAVADALATASDDDDDDVLGVTAFDMYSAKDGDATTPVEGPAAIDLAVTPDHVAVSNLWEDAHLEIDLTLTANLLLVKPDGNVLYLPIAKKATYWMTSGSNLNDPWLIDAMQGNLSWEAPTPTRPTAPATFSAPESAGS